MTKEQLQADIEKYQKQLQQAREAVLRLEGVILYLREKLKEAEDAE